MTDDSNLSEIDKTGELVSLEEFFDNAAIGLHIVGEDGTILRANKFELELLGYSKEEYVGHKITEFHADYEIIDDILHRLKGNQTIKEYPAKLKCKDGSTKQVLITSNVYWQDGKFVHTRCFTRELASTSDRDRIVDQLFEESHSFMTVISVPELRYLKSNEKHNHLLDKSEREIVGKTVKEVLPEMEAQGIIDLLKSVQASGKPYVAYEAPIKFGPAGNQKTKYLDFVYQPLKDKNGEVFAIAAQGYDVTERVRSKHAVENERENFRNLFRQTPEMVCILKGPDHVFEFVNDAHIKALGFDATGMSVRQAQPESVEVHGILDNVYQTGKTAELREIPVTVGNRLRYFNLTYAAKQNGDGKIDGILILGSEVTGEVESRKIVELQSQWLEQVFNQLQIPLILVDPKSGSVRFANRAAKSINNGLQGNVKDLGPEYFMTDSSGQRISYEMYPRNRAAKGERIAGSEYQWHTPSGTWDYLIFAEMMPDIYGHPESALVSYFDITGLKKAERRQRESEEQFQTLVNSIPQLAWMAEPDGFIFWYNQRWYDYTGATPKEMEGWGWQSVHDPKILPVVVEKWKHSIETGKSFEMTFPLKGKDGKFRWFLTRVIPFKDQSGKILRWFGTNTDVQAQREAELDLQLKSDALENSLNGFDIVDEEGKFIYVNKAYLDMWGFDSPEEVLGTSPASHCADPNVPIQIIKALKTTGECDIEFVAKRKDGSTFDVRMLAFLAHDFSGREIYPTTSIDITEAKRAADTLYRAKEEAERANKLKTAFLANMSHEIRTPLGAMIGFADLLRDPGLTSTERSNYIDILSRNGQSLSHIINDILDLSKVEAGHLSLEFTETNPEQIANDVVSLLRVKAKEKDLSLNLIADDSMQKSVVTDPNRLKQILMNLIGNSIKFTQFGSVQVKCFGCKTDTGRESVCFEISDTGIGIPENQKDRIFEMFVQADGSMARRFGGTGLGLALSRRLARALGGEIEVTHTVEGKGSTFLVKIEDQPERKNSDSTLKDEETLRADPLPNALEGIKILVVDDSPDNQQLIWHYLTKRGALVDTADNGVMGYRKAIVGDYDLVLMDIQMPEMDGYTATHKLRSAGYRKPILALTAHVLSDVRQKCLNVGCTGHLAKPINPKQLISTIADLVNV